MIIELFGPPGSGKTTFAKALATRLSQQGKIVELKLSSRPTEIRSHMRYQSVAFGRIFRPAAELLAIASHPAANSRDIAAMRNLLRTLPPTTTLSSFREGQYIVRLAHFWHNRSDAAHVIVCDQGFVQLVSSLALRARGADLKHIAKALDYIPRSDLAIRLHAPMELLKSRLQNRQKRQGMFESSMELDLETSLNSCKLIDCLHEHLLRNSRSVVGASSVDEQSLSASLDAIDKFVMADCGAVARTATTKLTDPRDAAAVLGLPISPVCCHLDTHRQTATTVATNEFKSPETIGPDAGNSLGDESKEIHRIRMAYAKRDTLPQVGDNNPGRRLMLRERNGTVERLLAERLERPLVDCRVLDVGCGTGELLGWFHERGVAAKNLFGIDLLTSRIKAARETYPDFNFVEGSAEHLDFPDNYFDIVVAFTAFSSILDDRMAKGVSKSMVRVLRSQGAVAWHDMRYPNPRNTAVRAVTARRIRELFPAFQLDLKLIYVLPPLAHHLGRFTDAAYPILGSFPFLRSHYCGLLLPQGTPLAGTVVRPPAGSGKERQYA